MYRKDRHGFRILSLIKPAFDNCALFVVVHKSLPPFPPPPLCHPSISSHSLRPFPLLPSVSQSSSIPPHSLRHFFSSLVYLFSSSFTRPLSYDRFSRFPLLLPFLNPPRLSFFISPFSPLFLSFLIFFIINPSTSLLCFSLSPPHFPRSSTLLVSPSILLPFPLSSSMPDFSSSFTHPLPYSVSPPFPPSSPLPKSCTFLHISPAAENHVGKGKDISLGDTAGDKGS